MLRPLLVDLQHAIQDAQRENITEISPQRNSIVDFKQRKKESLKGRISILIQRLVESTKENKITHELALKLQESQSIEELYSIIDKLSEHIVDEPRSITAHKIPGAIKEGVQLDVEEIDKCMKSGCYRSAIILCGRVLETVLHKKYYDATGQDLLEKAPGIGLGNLIAKLSEKGVSLDPALGNQIHLINQLRIHSVHKKRETFTPSEQQAQAVVLYTLDVMGKIFS